MEIDDRSNDTFDVQENPNVFNEEQEHTVDQKEDLEIFRIMF